MRRMRFYRAILTLLTMTLLNAVNLLEAHAQSPLGDGARLEKVATGFQFTEGPFWTDTGTLLFSDIPANAIYAWKPGDGLNGAEVYLKPSEHSNGIDALDNGNLVIAQHDRKVSTVNKQGDMEVLASTYKGKRLNSPNDLAVKSDGSIYFTDPPFAVKKAEKELDFNGVYRINPDGSLTLLSKEFEMPNGIVFSPDESKLYVNDSGSLKIMVFDVNKDGSLTNMRTFAEVSDPDAKSGAADGMEVDNEGNVYSTGQGGIWIFNSNGKKLERISMPERASNLAWGGEDGMMLYITATSSIYRIGTRTGRVR